MTEVETGFNRRLSYQKTILEDAPVFPKPLNYDDIDKAMFEFVDKELSMEVNGEKVPTFTVYSNQRFSEYTQTWEHTDENGNLYLNFKLINRDKNPSFGGNQGNYWKIPGNRRYTMLTREVLDDNGTESYEIYSMGQPYTVDLSYMITFVCNTFEKVNEFNSMVNKFFAARQYYIRPNGHYLPMVVDDISDASSYSVEDRRFYIQTVSVKVLAYIIDEKDFEVRRYPKRSNISLGSETRKGATVSIEEYEDNGVDRTMGLIVEFDKFKSTAKFILDCDMIISEVEKENVVNFKLLVNGTQFYTDKGTFNLMEGDEIDINIVQKEPEKEAKLKFIGIDGKTKFNPDIVVERVSDQPIDGEEIIVEK